MSMQQKLQTLAEQSQIQYCAMMSMNDQYNVGISIVQWCNGKETESLNSDDIPKKRV